MSSKESTAASLRTCRTAPDGRSSGPLEIDRPWDSFTDDQIGLLDHFGIDEFMVMGFCIGGPFIWNLLRRAPDRVVAAVLAQPSGSRPEARDLPYETNLKGWAAELVNRRPDITIQMADKFLTKTYRTNPDFVFTVTRFAGVASYPDPLRKWCRVSAVVLILSFAPCLLFAIAHLMGGGWPEAFALMAMHVAVWAICATLLPCLVLTKNPLETRPSDRPLSIL